VTPAFSSTPPGGFRLADIGQFEPSRRRKAQAIALRQQAGGVAHRRHSMPDLVPSTNELNIFGLIDLRSEMFRYLSRMSRHCRDWTCDNAARNACLAGADHLEAAARAQSTCSQISAG